MAKPVESTPLMITIAERVGNAVGRIVASTSKAVEGATKSLMPEVVSVAGPARPKNKTKTTNAHKVKRVTKRKGGAIKKRVARATTAARKRKVSKKKTKK